MNELIETSTEIKDQFYNVLCGETGGPNQYETELITSFDKAIAKLEASHE
mgnify:CR=1 FL=1